MKFLDEIEGVAEARAAYREARESREALAPINPATLAGQPVPERQWLVAEWIPIARVTALYGAGGEGKTLLAQMLATAFAIGKPWLGLPTRRARSLLLFCEDDLDEMHRRQEDINRHYGCDWDALGAMCWLPRLGYENALMRFSDGRAIATGLLDQLIAEARRHEAQLVVADTLADVFAGNENDRAQARAFAQQALGYIARETGGAVLALAHPSRAGMNSGTGESGSTAWDGTFRSRLHLSTPKEEDGAVSDDDARTLTRRKSNAARRNETIELRWKGGVFIPTSPAPGGIVASIERRSCERVFLDLLDRFAAEGQRVSNNSRAGNYAPRIFAQRPERERFTKADFERAMQALFAGKRIVVGTYRGANRHSAECIVRAPSQGALGASGCL